jgi:hypothetical protein
MNRLVWLATLALVFGLSGCFGEEYVDECEGSDCDEVELMLEDPVDEPETAVQPNVEDPAVEVPAYDFPVYNSDPTPVAWTSPEDHDYVNVNFEDIDDITPDQLSVEDMDKIDTLRDSIEHGLVLGKGQYLEAVSLSLQMMGVSNDYEGAVEDGFADLEQEPEVCPFAKYYDNGFEPVGATCDYLVDLAKVEVYSELSKELDKNPLPENIQASQHVLEANFWYEQGAISGVEEQRVVVRTDLKQRALCQKIPTPVESSYEKGVIVGRQHMAGKVNAWLAKKGHTADYPKMSNPIQVCNADQSMLLPAKQTALGSLKNAMDAEPLCADYVPPSEEGILQYNQAKIDYEKGVKEGISAEFAMAAVMVFKVIPCNVSDPIVLDLDGDGIELLNITKGVDFDLYGTGSKQAVAWVAPDDGLLVLDRNLNGTIDDGTELFGNLTDDFSDGFEHLAELDRAEFGGNSDGVIDANDAAFAHLMVWKDANTDGISVTEELVSLSALEVTSIRLEARDSNRISDGQRIARISVVTTDNNRLAVGDAFLTSAPYARLATK